MVKQTKLPGRILVIDDDHFTRCLYSDLLREDGHEVATASGAKEAFSILNSQAIDLVITDLVMPGIDGLGVIHHINEGFPHVDIIVSTGYAAVDSAVEALKSGAKDFLRKPVNHEEFRLTVHRCLEQRNLFSENQEFKRYLSLFEACHRISGCLEIPRLLPMALNALVQELDGHDGVVCHRNLENPEQDVFLGTGISFDDQKAIEEYAQKFDVERVLKADDIEWIENPTYPKEISRLLALPVKLNASVQSAFFIFYSEEEIQKMKDEDRILQRARFIGRQIALALENANEYQQAMGQAFLDDLTGLYNSKHLYPALKREVKRSQRFEHSLSVLFIDMDHFKKVNDTHGHLIGSKVLKEVGAIIKNCMREIDTAIRYGGDEFTLILVNTNSEGAFQVGERIRKQIEGYIFVKEENINLKLTACVGIATYPEHAESVEELIDMADQAMYRGKRTSRNVVYLFRDSEK